MGATFEQWVAAAIDHPVDGPEWYWGETFDTGWESLGVSDAVTVAYLTRLLRDPEPLRRYSLPQIAQGMWFLIGESSPAAIGHLLVRGEVPLEERIAGIRAMADFFRKFVAPAATGPADADNDRFHGAIYMWWDIFPSWGGTQSGEPEIHRACLDVMAEELQLPSELCQLGALHGLNHWHLHYAREVEQIIDGFLAGNAGTQRMRDYAASARLGCCQ